MPNRPISILYIDDDPGLTRLVQKALGRRGYLVEASSTGESGLARLALGGIDVIALDHYLPTGTGLDFLRDLGATARSSAGSLCHRIRRHGSDRRGAQGRRQ
jgi:DNA-binding response OmpR family regulator